MSKLYMRFIEGRLTELYLPHIDVSDRPFLTPDEERKAKLSAALAALAIQIQTDCDIETACAAVVDGSRDGGVDAIAIDESGEAPVIHFVQAKWNDDGSASFGEGDVRDFLDGVDSIVDRNYDQMNAKIRAMRSRLNAAMSMGRTQLLLTITATRNDNLHVNTERKINDALARWNDPRQPRYDWDLIKIRDCVEMLESGRRAPVDVTATFEDYLEINEPYKAFTGTLDVAQLAGWYDDHRDRLLDRNIRLTLPESEVNVSIQESIERRPELFWYLSNGITVVCDRIDRAVHSRRRGPAKDGYSFDLYGASIVNGAQTLGAIRRALVTPDSGVEDARVLVKVISLEGAPPDLGEQITIATNTQNKVEERDFKANDPIQVRLRREFGFSAPPRLYVIKRGETVPEDGLGIEEAARALAATFRDPRLAADARRAPSSLWGSEHYRRLFGRRDVTAEFVWRSVILLRAVAAGLVTFTESRSSRTNNLAGYGNLLITHVVHRKLGEGVLKAAEVEWGKRLREVPDLVTATFATMMNVIDQKYGRRSHIHAAVHNPDKAFEVVTETLAVLDGKDPAAAVAAAEEQQRRTRRGRSTNAVRLIVEDGRIPAGTTLTFTSVTSSDRREMREWLADDESRARATWTNDENSPLTWGHDGQRYSPSGLTKQMRTTAYGNEQQVQGPKYWLVPGQGTLAQIADQIRTEQDYADEE